jgi:hypothetical protein
MKKRARWLLLGSTTILAGMLLINPPLKNPPLIPGKDVFATNAPPQEIVTLIHGACYDCHSDETKWPWYSHVAPVSWWLVGHVNDGRKRLDFSQWPHDDPRRAAKKWRRIGETVADGDMPLPGYDKMHPAARLTDAQRKQLSDWAEQEADRIRPTTEESDK